MFFGKKSVFQTPENHFMTKRTKQMTNCQTKFNIKKAINDEINTIHTIEHRMINNEL